MSARPRTGSLGKSCDDSDAEEHAPPPKKISTTARLLTVFGYMVCVSSAAFMAAAYYIFLWDPYEGSTPRALALTARVTETGS